MLDQNSSIFPERNILYASFLQRFAASFIDGIILWAFSAVLNVIFVGELFGANIILTLISVPIDWLYYALLESGPKQATLGKMAAKIKVTNMEGGKISFSQATGRYFAKIISTIILFIGYFMMLWDDKKQTLHDKMANTLVVRNENY